MTTLLSAPEQSRARHPDEEGYVERDGVRVFWERYGTGERAILLPPTWEIVHSRCWKGQIPYLARHGRVVTFDPRGNGRSDRPDDFEAYRRREFAADALAVLDATGVDRAVVVSWCDMGESLILAAEHPERVAGLVFIAPPLSLGEAEPRRLPLRRRPGDRRGLGQGDPRLLAARLARLPRVLLRQVPHRAALDQADRGLRRLGGWTPRWRRSWPGSAAGRPRSSTRRRWRRSARGSAARCW